MTSRIEAIDRALVAKSRRHVRTALGLHGTGLSILEMERLSQHLRHLAEPLAATRIALLRTYTTELLEPYWTFSGLLYGIDPQIDEAPYGVVHAEADEAQAVAKADVVVVLLRMEDLDPRLSHSLCAIGPDQREAV